MDDGEWLLIAEFARRCRLPVSTLRYYDRVQLLPPASVDAATGYRRYRASQLPTAVTIARLRAAGTTPEVIARILRGGLAAASALADERRRLNEEITERMRSLAYLDGLSQLASLEPGVPHQVELPPMQVPALGFSADLTALTTTVVRSIASLRTELRRRQQLPPHVVWGALLPLDLEERVEGHVFACNGSTVPADGLANIALPSGPAFEIAHAGGHDDLSSSYDHVLTTVGHSGFRPVGSVIEHYSSSSQDYPLRVRIQVPVDLAEG